MGEIVDFFSKRKYGELVTSEEIDKEVGEEGVFLGTIPEPMKEELRSTMDLLHTRSQQINNLIEEQNRLMEGYGILILKALIYLDKDLEEHDPDLQDIYVDAHGKVWLRATGYTPE